MENMINESIIRIAPSFTEEELELLKKAREREIVFDGDCPETTPERALKFRRVNAPRAISGQ